MAELKVYLAEELDKRFRMLAMRVYGYGRGSLSKAAEDALAKWCDNHGDKIPVTESKIDRPAVNLDPAALAEERPMDSSAVNEPGRDSVRNLS